MTILHARESAPWSGPNPEQFPDTWGTLFAKNLGPSPHLSNRGSITFALYYDRECEREFARHAGADEVASGEVIQSGRRFDVVDTSASAQSRAA